MPGRLGADDARLARARSRRADPSRGLADLLLGGRRRHQPDALQRGLLGGTWLASLTGDLGAGKFDGAYLVNNFENLNPSNTYWSKLYNLYSKVDTERERFLEFERWWGGHYLLNKEEMEWIAQNLFVGNKLAAGEVESFDGKHRVDIRNIRSPIIVFASWGDNITPPQQALNWIPDLYRASKRSASITRPSSTACTRKSGTSASSCRRASRRRNPRSASTLELIDSLPPGLYEAVITDTHPQMPGLEYVEGRYLIQFQPRTIDDILKLDDGRGDERAFEVVNRSRRSTRALRNVPVAGGEGVVERGRRASRAT